MSDEEVIELNTALARRINAEALADPTSPYFGKIVCIANGKVAFLAEQLDLFRDRLMKIEPNPRRCCCFPAGVDSSKVHRV